MTGPLPEPARELAGHFLRAAAGFSAIPAWMERHALTAISPGGRQRAWAVGRRFTGNPDHGFAIAERVPVYGIGSLWALWCSAPDLATVYAVYPRVAPLLVDTVRVSLHERERSVSITYAPPDGVRFDRAEEDCRATHQVELWRALYRDRSIAPRSVAFSYPRPRSTAVHERVLGTRDLRFGQPALQLELDLRWWRTSLPGADPEAYRVQLAHAEQQLRALADASLEQRVDGLLTQLLSTDARAERIATLLGISPRTLQRRLARGGHTFRTLIERARQREDALFREASALFGFETLSPRERVQLLGFANGGALRNALRRWAVRS
ncbi:MAG: AraC family transcriptional regulator ligand-binding domain-containing protein [Polyangiales bacterium]